MTWRRPEHPPEPDPAAFSGLAGYVVRTLGPHTEADPMALLLDLLTSFGNAVGLSPYMLAGDARHHARLHVVLAGVSSRSRKGTSHKAVERVMRHADPEWVEQCVVSGLSTGEGLVAALARRPDSRLLACEAEWARTLRVAGRDGNTLSAVLRSGWDQTDFFVLTRKDPLEVKGKHVSVIGHVTVEELVDTLSSLEAANGFGNRLLFAFVDRRHKLPMGGSLSEEDYRDLGLQIRHVLQKARTISQVKWSPEAIEPWRAFYLGLPDDLSGMAGHLTSRAEAQVLRLSLIYALLDATGEIRPEHLRAAIAVWDYSERSVHLIWKDRSGRPNLDRLIPHLEEAGPAGLDRRDLHRILNGKVRKEEIDLAVATLETEGRIDRFVEATGGRPREVVRIRNTAQPTSASEVSGEAQEEPSGSPSEYPSNGHRRFARLVRFFGHR